MKKLFAGLLISASLLIAGSAFAWTPSAFSTGSPVVAPIAVSADLDLNVNTYSAIAFVTDTNQVEPAANFTLTYTPGGGKVLSNPVKFKALANFDWKVTGNVNPAPGTLAATIEWQVGVKKDADPLFASVISEAAEPITTLALATPIDTLLASGTLCEAQVSLDSQNLLTHQTNAGNPTGIAPANDYANGTVNLVLTGAYMP